jgi:para-nitrobenzyl esterase
MEVVKTDSGYVSGAVLGEPDKPVYVYRGIPYAAPPVGDLRWRPPQPVAPWQGIRECTAFSAQAPSLPSAMGLPNLLGGRSQDEDCLYLNVLTPAKKAGDNLAVMVWMHGGGFDQWSGNDRLYNRLRLPMNGVVLVNVNMRLGPLGCLAHPLLSRESPKGVSGNYLFLDMVAALKWVQNNISAFGGDPGRVTIFGESGGSFKVLNLMASPLAKGLFHRVIGQSGAVRGIPLKEIETRGEKVFAKLGVDKRRDPLAAARGVPWQKILEANGEVGAELKLREGTWDSAVDGWFLPDTPVNIFKSGRQNIVPFILGANLGEINGPGVLVWPQVIPSYLNLFRGANKVGGKAYAYIFDHVPAGWKNEGAVSAHTMELPYVFGDWDNQSDIWEAIFFFTKPCGLKSADPGLNDLDRKVSEMVMQLWTNFAKTGNPSLPGVVEWPAWEESGDQYLYIAESLQVKSAFSKIAQK